MPAETSSRTDTPENARAALATVHAMQIAGRRHGVWPRWTRWIELLTTALFLLAFSYGHSPLAMMGAGLAMLAFRFWCVRRFGALARWTRFDSIATLLVIALTLGLASAQWRRAAHFVPLAVIGGWAVSAIALDEMKRRAASKRASAIDLT